MKTMQMMSPLVLGACCIALCGRNVHAQQVRATAEMAQTPEMQLRASILVPERRHTDYDYAWNMLEGMYLKEKAAKPALTRKEFALALHDKAVAGDVNAGYYYGAARMTAFGVAGGPDREVEGFIGTAMKAAKPEAIRDYAILTFIGVGMKADRAAAFALAKKAADMGLPSGMSLEAEFLQAGVVGKENLIDALDLFKKAAAAGDVVAMNNVGEILAETDPAQAMTYFRRAAAGGDDRASLAYGMGLVRGNGVAKDEKAGVELVAASATLGNPDAQRLMGVFNLNGSHGVAENETLGRLYMEAAAINGDSDAQIELGIMHLDGLDGVAKNHDVGMEWMMKASKQGNPRALEEMKKRM